MKILALLLLMKWAVLNEASIADSEWLEFKTNYGKAYKDVDEELLRYKIFLENKKEISEHNEAFDKGETTFSMGINEYSDMTFEEFSSRILMKTRDVLLSKPINDTFQTPDGFKAPASVDWRKHGYVTSVKNQKDCGSCYAFSAVGGLEGQHFKKHHRLVSLSEQNIVDCSKRYGNYGCDGGYLERSFEYVIKNKGIDTEKSYPYKGRDESCHYKAKDKGTTCKSYKTVAKNEGKLRDAVATVGPVPACIYVESSFHRYKKGIYYGKDCPKHKLNHCILIVGYGAEHGIDYWLVKNSWGKKWGEDGYVKMSRNKNNNCGIASNAVYPVI